MDKFLALPADERTAAFTEAANRRGILPIIIEKDFWVCWTLAYLFSIPELAPHITFKGGTSLSKAYGLIERFSEDIDLTISKDFLNIPTSAEEPGISGKEKDRRIDALKQTAQQCIEQVILPMLQQQFSTILGAPCNLSIDQGDKDQQTILFAYPKLLNYGQGWSGGGWGAGAWNEGEAGYIKPAVRLEFGARGDIQPYEQRAITPYVAETFPGIFQAPSHSIPTLSAVRTFWEKATALHAFYHGARHPERWSRHYYDIYMMTEAGIAEQALENTALLEDVVRNKSIYFKDSKASYDTAIPGTLKLVPPPTSIAELREDYTAMNVMFMGEAPAFDKLLHSLEMLEQEINSL